MSTTIRDSAYDDEIADLVTRTVRAVADATPVDDAPSALLGGSDHDVLRLAPVAADQHRRVRRGRLLRVAAVAAAVAVVAGLVWARSDDAGDESPTDVTDQAPGPRIRMEAGWLPPGLEGATPAVERSPGIDVPVDAMTWGAGNEAVVAAAVDLGDDADPNTVRRRVEQVRGALEGIVHPWEHDFMATEVVGSRGGVAVARSGPAAEVEAVAGRIAEGAWPADVAPEGEAAQPISLTWLTGVGPSATVVYQAADQSASVGISVVAGDLPEPSVLAALQPGAEPIEVRGRGGWNVVPAGSDNTWVTWQEEPGLVVTMAGGVSHDDLLAVAEDLVAVEEPAAVAELTEVVATGTVEGMDYRIESAPPEETGRGWCTSLMLDGDPAGRVCQHMVDGIAMTGSDVRPAAIYDGGLLWWGSPGPGVAAVRADSGVEVETIEAVPADGGDASFPVVLLPVPDTGGSVTFQLLGPDGEDRGTVTSGVPDWAG